MTTNRFAARLESEKGSILIFTLLVMLILTVIGLAASTTTEIELKITTNDTLTKKAFSSADAGISYAVSKSSLYGDSNIDPAAPVTEAQTPTNDLSFAVTATYVAGTTGGSFARGSGFSATGKTKYHIYEIDSSGNSSGNATCDVSAKGYRIGL